MTLHQTPRPAGNPGRFLPASRVEADSAGTSPAADPFSVAGAFPRRGRKGKPMEFGGKVWPSRSELARHLGLCAASVSKAITRGRLHSLGKGPTPGGPVQIQAMNAARRQPVAAAGWSWGSQREAARAMGVNDSTVYVALQRGSFERLVLKRLGARNG